MSYFNYEKTLQEKGLSTTDLPKEIQDKIKLLIGTARKFDQSEDGSDEQIELNKELDRLDDEIDNMLNSLQSSPDPKKSEDENSGSSDPNEKKSGSNAGVQILIGAGIIAGLFWVGKKFLGK